jgi:hypothetical protein
MPKERPGLTLFNGATATSTSDLFSPGRNGNFDAQFKKTNTGTGDVAFQTNDVDDVTYQADPTANWIQHDLVGNDDHPVSSGKLTVPATNPWSDKIKLRGISARRCRFVFTKAGGTVAFSGWLSGN